jgi:ribonuclease H / adenosylcobalamin/alpha-ribazole phosphatase
VRLVVEADGGARGNPGPAGYGAVVRDATTGQVLAEVADFIGHATNNVAEYRGLIAGLTAAHALDPDAEIEVRMDSKLVVEQMSGRWQIKHVDMRTLAKQARDAHDMSRITFNWIPREANSHADRLANEAMDAQSARESWTPASELGVDGGSLEPPVAHIPFNLITGRLDSLGDPFSLFMVRHGETALTPSRTFSGAGGSDPELSQHGLWQADRVADAIAPLGITAVIASPMQRAQQTAKAIATTLGLDVELDPRWLEVNFGKWDGRLFADIVNSESEHMERWLTGPDERPPGGESYLEMAARVDEAVIDLRERWAGERVLVVSHSTPIRHVIRQALQAPAHATHRLEVLPCSINMVAYWNDETSLVRAVNETAHLRD